MTRSSREAPSVWQMGDCRKRNGDAQRAAQVGMEHLSQRRSPRNRRPETEYRFLWKGGKLARQ